MLVLRFVKAFLWRGRGCLLKADSGALQLERGCIAGFQCHAIEK